MITDVRMNRRAAVHGAALALGVAQRSVRADDAIAPEPVQLPQDEGVHPDANFEWWYYTGHLTTESGTELGFEHVFFRANEGTVQGWAAHCAMTDKTALAFSYDQQFVLGDGPNSGTAERLDFAIDDWRIQGTSDRGRVIGSVEGAEWTLLIEAEKPVVLHGGDGFSGPTVKLASYYYSRTRCSVTGTVVRDGVEETVTGEAWMDHQWGPSIDVLFGGWDWYAFQLESGTELMVFSIRDENRLPLGASGTWVEADGTAVEVLSGGVEIVAGEEWTSPETGATYPTSWKIRVPGLELELAAAAIIPEQELDTRETTGVVYWEGAMTVEGTQAGEQIQGRGYVELTGYAGPPVRPTETWTPGVPRAMGRALA